MSHTYKHNGHEFPSVTTILGAVDGQKAQPLMQWSANMCVEWIREHGKNDAIVTPGAYVVDEDALNQARFAYKDVSQKALDVGSDVHGLIEEYLHLTMADEEQSVRDFMVNAISQNRTEQTVNAFGAFLQWMDEHEVKPIALEQTVYGPCWAGMLDFVGWFDGKIYVIDWKTSKSLQKSYRYQIAAYRWAWNGMCWDSECPVSLTGDVTNTLIEATGCGVLRIDKATGEPEWKDHSKTYEKDLATFNAAVEFYMHDHPRIAKKAGWKP